MNQIIEAFQNTTPEQYAGAALAGLVLGMIADRLRRKKVLPPIDPLDVWIMQWAPGCLLTVRQLLASIMILGATGSGKTSGSGRHLMRAIVQFPTSGGLILAAKIEDADDVRAIFRAAGRTDDLIVVNPDGELGFNYLDFAISLGADARDVTRWVMTPAETLRARESKGGGEMGDFWDRENERLIYNAVLVILLARGRITISDIQQFIMTALQTPQQVSSPEWQGCFHDKCMRAAFEVSKTPIQQHDFNLATDYFFREWPTMADKTRSSILTGVLGMLHCMNSGLARVLCSDKTNVTPAEMLRGRWIVINLPPSKYGDTGMFVNSVWKYATQKMILRRKAQGHDGPVVLWIDEFQLFANSHDWQFLSTCRSSRGCQVMLSQTIHSIIGAMRGENARNQAMALIGNAGHKVFHSCDADTARYASELLGREERTKIGGSIQPAEDMWDEMFGTPKITTSFSDQWEPVLEPNVFMTLCTGGPQNHYQATAIVIKNGEPFPGGGNWRFVTFNQR